MAVGLLGPPVNRILRQSAQQTGCLYGRAPPAGKARLYAPPAPGIAIGSYVDFLLQKQTQAGR